MTLTQQDIVYDPTHDLKTDIYLPEGTPTATILDIHGGGWFRGDKAKDADWAAIFNAAGYAVVTPNYRLMPDGPYPAPLDNMHTLIAWLRTGAAGVPIDKIAAVGGSAGGNLAVELGIAYGFPVVSLSGILDIADWLAKHEDVVAKQGDTSGFNATASANINQDGANDAFYKWFVVNYFNGRTDQFEEATPSGHVTDTTGPMFLLNSLHEFVPTSGVIQLATALNEHQIPYSVRMLPGTRHAKGYLPDVSDDILRFLARTL